MTTEMDVMRMDERQRMSWLRANRATLMLVGITWIVMIGWELSHDRFPAFLMTMVPVFALVRFLMFRFYQKIPRNPPV